MYFYWHCMASLHLCKQWHYFFEPFMHVNQLESTWFGPPHLVVIRQTHLYKSEGNGKGFGSVASGESAKTPTDTLRFAPSEASLVRSVSPPASHSKPWKNIRARTLGAGTPLFFWWHHSTILKPYTNTLLEQQSPYPWIRLYILDYLFCFPTLNWMQSYATSCALPNWRSLTRRFSRWQGCLDFIEILEREVLPQLSPQCSHLVLGYGPRLVQLENGLHWRNGPKGLAFWYLGVSINWGYA